MEIDLDKYIKTSSDVGTATKEYVVGQMTEKKEKRLETSAERVKAIAFTGAAAAAGVGIGVVGVDVKRAMTGGAMLNDTHDASSPTGAPIPDVGSGAADFDGARVPTATHVNDQMDFSEAFSSARQEIGPGGVFFWRGQSFNTYTADEWKQFSPEYRNAFSSSLHSPSKDVPVDDDGAVTAGAEQTASVGGDGVVIADAEQAGSVDDDGVVIADVEQAGSVDDDGVVIASAEQANPADGDGVLIPDEIADAPLVDSGTGEPDILADSTDEQGAIPGVSQQDYLAMNELPDYANNADVSDLV